MTAAGKDDFAVDDDDVVVVVPRRLQTNDRRGWTRFLFLFAVGVLDLYYAAGWRLLLLLASLDGGSVYLNVMIHVGIGFLMMMGQLFLVRRCGRKVFLLAPHSISKSTVTLHFANYNSKHTIRFLFLVSGKCHSWKRQDRKYSKITVNENNANFT